MTISCRLASSSLLLPPLAARELADDVLDCTADLPAWSYLQPCESI